MKNAADLRRLAVSRSLFPATTLEEAMARMAFVQADPIRAPARAQDLTLRPRVKGYRAGDLDARYPSLAIEEDVFINYGFVTRMLQALMHPRANVKPPANQRVKALLRFVRERGAVHPREAEAHFSHGTVTNYWGGTSSATTHLLEAMHYRGLLRVVRRDAGIRIYGPQQHGDPPSGAAARRARVDSLVDAVVDLYAPLPARSLAQVIARLRYAAPQWHGELRTALQRAKTRFPHARIDSHEWYWPESDGIATEPNTVRLLAPFDPVVWDRLRFELLWGWAYRFEAYTPRSKRKLGYYALPMLWRDRAIGWANISRRDGDIVFDLGYVSGSAPRDRAFRTALDEEIEAMRSFLQRGSLSVGSATKG